MPLSWAMPILEIPSLLNNNLQHEQQQDNNNANQSSFSCPNTPTTIESLGFRYSWPVKVTTRQLSPTEAIILQISPKFATVHDHVR